MTNQQIAHALRELAAYLRLFGENPWKSRAYDTAAGAVEALGPALGPTLAAGRLTDVPGIGQAIASVIAEIEATGTCARLESLRAELPPGLLALAELPGLTLRRLQALHRDLGVTGAGDLRSALARGALRGLKGFGPRTEARILAGLDQPPAQAPRLHLVDAQEVAERLAVALAHTPGVSRVEVAGAIRRWKETVGTVRLVGASEAPGPALDTFLAGQLLIEVARPSAGVAVGRLPAGGRLEVSLVPALLFASTWLRRSSAPAHLSRLETLARQRGVDLAACPAADEAAVYRALGLPEIPPELREDASSVEAALAGDDFADLVTVADIKGMTHCHTTHSDGRASVEEMARAAQDRGMAYLTITDHSPSAFYAGGVTAEGLPAQWAEIEAVGRQLDIAVLRGTESDILADGALDYPDEILGRLEVVIASIHNRQGMDQDQMTARLVGAMRQPVFKIWGHPLGRLILRRDPIACRVDEVLDALARGRGAVEINGDPYRLDLPPQHIPAARRRGLSFVISTDAHSVNNLDNLRFGVAMARRGGVRRSEVLNAQPASVFREVVRPAPVR